MRSFNLSKKNLSSLFSCLFIHTVWRFWLWNQTTWVQILVVPLTNCIFLGKIFCVSVSSISKGAHNSNNRLIGLLDFPCGSDVKNPPSVRKIWVIFLGREDPLEEGTATHSSILAWRILVDREAWWTTVHGVAKSRTRLSD